MKIRESRTRSLSNQSVGILLMLVAMAIIPFLDALAKGLSADYSALQLVWARYVFHLLPTLPFVLWHHGSAILRPKHVSFQIIRGVLLVLGTGFFFAGIAIMPLADALAVAFVYPCVVTAFAPWVLGEKVGVRRWSAIAVGLIGTLIVIRPGPGILTGGALFILLSAGCYAFYVLVTRKIAGSVPASILLLYTAVVGALVSSLAVPFVWVWPTPTVWVAMVAMGLIAAFAHLCIIMANQRAEATQLVPLAYTEIIMATILGYVFFDDFPDLITWIGVSIIIASGTYIAWREARLGR